MPAAAARAAILLCGVGLYATLAHLGTRDESPTFDEVAHLPAGYTHLTRGDYRLVPEQPPLVKSLAALPLLAMNPRVPEQDAAWARRRPYEFGRRFLFEWNDARALIAAGRHAAMVLPVVLLALIATCGFRRWGLAVGAIALYLGALHPDLLAHGPLVTTDAGAALLMFATLLQFEKIRRAPGVLAALLGGLLLGAAFAVKFSSLLLLPLLAALIAADGILLPAAERARRWLRLAALLGLMLLVSVLVIWAAYGLHAHVTPDPAVNEAFTLDHERPASELVWQGALAAQRAHLLPDAYLYGLLRFSRHSEQRRAFLLGERSDEGWWYYFPVTLALKTPLPLLILIGAAGGFAIADRRRHARETWLWLPPAIYLAVAMSRSLNIGHRHLLPLLPFLVLASARAAMAIWRRGHPAARAAVVVLLAWHGASVLRVHPHYLAYFNELVGPDDGYRYLVDSNLDWGQDLPGLKSYLDRAGLTSVKLSYFGTAEPFYYGIGGERLPGYPAPAETARAVDPGDLVAVSATNLQGVYLTDDPDAERLMRRLRRQKPIASIGYSILIYRAEFSWRRP